MSLESILKCHVCGENLTRVNRYTYIFKCKCLKIDPDLSRIRVLVG